MHVGGAYPYLRLESHSDLGDNAAEMQWRPARNQRQRREAFPHFFFTGRRNVVPRVT